MIAFNSLFIRRLAPIFRAFFFTEMGGVLYECGIGGEVGIGGAADVEGREFVLVGDDIPIDFQCVGYERSIDLVDAGSQGCGVGGRGKEAGVEELNDFAGAVQIAGEDGQAGSQAFYYRESKAFKERGLDEEVIIPEMGFDPIAVFLSDKNDFVLKMAVCGQGLQFGEGVAGADEMEVEF
jgi:hypothetical protein